MLVAAYFNTTSSELNKLIHEENCKYLEFINYNDFEHVTKLDIDDWNKIQKVSISAYGRVLGYFSASISQVHEKINSLYLVKFNSKFSEEDKLVAKDGLREFIEQLRTNHRFRYIQFCACASNYACKLCDSDDRENIVTGKQTIKLN